MTLPETFYTRSDVVAIARELLGKILVTNFNGIRTSGMITETEAYAGVTDKASHAYGGRRTARTDVMYMRGGVAYVYLCYGIHHLFNVVTNIEDIPHAVLVRAIEPIEGIDVMLARRHKNKIHPTITSGPGVMSAAMGIHYSHSGMNLQGNDILIEDRETNINSKYIVACTRVGVGYALEDALLPYRFYIKGNSYISNVKGL